MNRNLLTTVTIQCEENSKSWFWYTIAKIKYGRREYSSNVSILTIDGVTI